MQKEGEAQGEGPPHNGVEERFKLEEEARLFVGSDNCQGDSARSFLNHQLAASAFQGSAALRRFLARKSWASPYVHNVGIVGGRLPVLDRFRRRMAERTRAHYSAVPGNRYVVDSVLLNDLLLSDAHEGPIVGGFPRGPVNLPMFGDTCVRPRFNDFCLAARFRTCRARHLLAAMEPNYFFAHKLDCGKTLRC